MVFFFAWDGCIDYIDNTLYFNTNAFNSSIYTPVFNTNNHFDGIDIYLFPDSNPGMGGRANGVGNSSEFFVSGTWPDAGPTALTSVISHEMGHVLFLWHTHHGCESGDWELTDKSNCAHAGDFVCDTPADPRIEYNLDVNCQWTGLAHPICSSLAPEPLSSYRPDTRVIMAYTDPWCATKFTPGQGQRMHLAIELLPYLQTCEIEETLESNGCICSSDDIFISQNTIFDTPIMVSGSIYIKTAQTLSVTSILSLNETKKIVVEAGGTLILDGGILKNCTTTSQWGGITVSEGGHLIVKNNAIIKNATVGISSTTDSHIFMENAVIESESVGFIGFNFNNNPIVGNFENVVIDNYFFGIYGSNSYKWYDFNQYISKNCHYGAYLYKTPAIIRNSKIDAQRGVYLSSCTGSVIADDEIEYIENGIECNSSEIVTISGNTIGTNTKMGKIAISLNKCSGSLIRNNAQIQATNLGIRLNNSSSILRYNNIKIYGKNNQYGGGVLIIESPKSIIEQNYLDINQSAFGIETNLSNNTHIFNNQIDHFSSIATRTAAIRSMGSMDETINDNIINGVANTTGIIAQNTTSNQYLCNIIDNTHEGLGVYYNAEMQNIRGNEIDAWTDLAIRSQVGPQVHHGNKFVGGKARADELNSDEIAGSQFFVNSSIPYLMPTDRLPSSGWFFDELSANTYICTGTQGPSWTPFNGGGETEVCAYWTYLKSIRTAKPEMFFVKLYHLLKYAKTKPGFVLPGCVKGDGVFLSVCGITKLMDVGVALHKMGTSPVNASNLNTLQVQYGLQTTDAGRASVKNQIQTELALIVPILDTKAGADTIKLDSLTTELNTISCTSVIVSKWKDIFKLYVKYLKTGEVAVADRPTLVAYSSECADIYGDAIHVARAMANTYDNTYFDAYDVCITPTTPRSITTSEVATAISVHPNPTSGILYLNLPDNYTGQVTVRDIDGKAIIHQEIKSSNLTNLDLTMYSGVYFVTFTSDSGEQSVHKVILIK